MNFSSNAEETDQPGVLLHTFNTSLPNNANIQESSLSLLLFFIIIIVFNRIIVIVVHLDCFYCCYYRYFRLIIAIMLLFDYNKIFIYTFANDSTVHFAGESFQVSFFNFYKMNNNKLIITILIIIILSLFDRYLKEEKYSMNITNWQFKYYSNKLQVELESDVTSNNGNECKRVDTNSDKSDSLLSIKLSLNGAILYLFLFSQFFFHHFFFLILPSFYFLPSSSFPFVFLLYISLFSS